MRPEPSLNDWRMLGSSAWPALSVTERSVGVLSEAVTVLNAGTSDESPAPR